MIIIQVYFVSQYLFNPFNDLSHFNNRKYDFEN